MHRCAVGVCDVSKQAFAVHSSWTRVSPWKNYLRQSSRVIFSNNSGWSPLPGFEARLRVKSFNESITAISTSGGGGHKMRQLYNHIIVVMIIVIMVMGIIILVLIDSSNDIQIIIVWC